ncbi:MAG: transcriptional repressor LexA [Calditerrivibrio sp.]|nr:transcriptional repressor LexA [Calditerrivibrio sp.]
MEISKRQLECLSFIKDYIAEYGYPPTVQEICDGLKIKSKNAGFKLLKALQDKGLIKRNPMISRGIDLISKKGLPIVGKITAGLPITAEENIEGYLSLDEFVGDDRYFGLRVVGDSMMGRGIFDGDLVIIKKQPDIFNNQIGAFMINGEFTLKTFKVSENGEICLKPENDSYLPIYVGDGDMFEVIGVLRMVVRLFGDHYEARKY